jgi:hypothetical protein
LVKLVRTATADARIFAGGDGDGACDDLVVVAFPFTGFFAPVRNDVQPGRAVPVKFSLGGDQGLNVFASGHPRSQPNACEGGAS